MKERELCTRLFRFAVDTIRLIKLIGSSSALNVIKFQLTKSATSCGANYEESQAACSRADFLNKVRISLKEMRESNYWLRILGDLDLRNKREIDCLVKESVELKNILGAISKNTALLP
jgi:four helix bundle protein